MNLLDLFSFHPLLNKVTAQVIIYWLFPLVFQSVWFISLYIMPRNFFLSLFNVCHCSMIFFVDLPPESIKTITNTLLFAYGNLLRYDNLRLICVYFLRYSWINTIKTLILLMFCHDKWSKFDMNTCIYMIVQFKQFYAWCIIKMAIYILLI